MFTPFIPRKQKYKYLRLPASLESSHQMVIGDTGAGKSMKIRQDLIDARDNGFMVLINDPEREYVREFYNEGRGDWILDPTDERCPWWEISDEFSNRPEAKGVARSLFPLTGADEQSATAKIFNNWTIDLFAYIGSKHRPSTAEMAEILSDYDLMKAKIGNDTYLRYALDQNAADQRAGILGTVGLAADPLSWMPPKRERGLTRRKFAMRQWCKNPNGWIFLTSSPTTQRSLLPLQSMFFDLAILGLLTYSPDQLVKIICDEGHTLQTLPQLHDGITRIRKRGHQIIYGIQNKEALERLYGRFEKTIFSQCYTKWIFATSEEASAASLERSLGQHKILRLKHTHSKGRGYRSTSDATEQLWEPLVRTSEIMGMANLDCLFLQRGFMGDLVSIELRMPVIELPRIAPAWVSRSIPDRKLFIANSQTRAAQSNGQPLTALPGQPLPQNPLLPGQAIYGSR